MKRRLLAAGLSAWFMVNLGAAQAKEPRRRALILGLDGTSGYLLEKRALVDQQAPALAQLMQSGTYAPCARSNDPRCARTHAGFRHDPAYEWVTGPGWAAVLSGADTKHHGVQSNGHERLSAFYAATRTYPSFLTSLRRAGLQTAAAGTGAFLTSQDGNDTYHGVTDYECGIADAGPTVAVTDRSSCNLDFRRALASDDGERDERAKVWLAKLIASGEPDLLMVVFDLIDGAGHGHGYSDNPGYMAAISDADRRIGELLHLVKKRRITHNEEWLVVVTSDHGGHDNPDHSGGHDRVLDLDEAIPFIMSVFSPRDYRPLRLTAPITQMDVKPTLLRWFGLPPEAGDGHAQG